MERIRIIITMWFYYLYNKYQIKLAWGIMGAMRTNANYNWSDVSYAYDTRIMYVLAT